MVRDSNPMRVATEISQGVFRSDKRPLRIDNPFLTKGLSYELREDFGPSEWLHQTVKPEFVVGESFLQRFGELTAKDFGQYVDWKEELLLRRDPMRAIWRQSASRHDTVDVGMVLELLIPTMQHTEEAYVCAQMLRIASDLKQCLGTDSKE